MASSEGVVIACHTVDQWNQQLEKHKGSRKLVVVDFTASWCGPCRVIAPILAELAKKMTHVTFLKVDVDELGSIAEEYSVQAMPTFLFIKDGEKVHEFFMSLRVLIKINSLNTLLNMRKDQYLLNVF